MNRLTLLFVVLFSLNYEVNAGICGSINELKNIICHTLKYYFPKLIPQSAVALYFLDRVFEAESSSWLKVKTDVELYVDEVLTGIKWRDIDGWHKSMTARIKTCTTKRDHLKVACLKNLHEDISGFEPKFRGYTRKEMAIFLKYYDIFVVSYLSISDLLKDLSSDKKLNETIDIDVSLKAKIFVKYLENALPQARLYACRNYKITVEKDNGFWWSFDRYWPSDVEKIAVPTDLLPSYYQGNVASKNVPDIDISYKGCGVLKKAVEFRSYIYDTKEGLTLKGGPWRYESCSYNNGVAMSVFNAKRAWYYCMKKCIANLQTNFWLSIEYRISALKTLIKN